MNKAIAGERGEPEEYTVVETRMGRLTNSHECSPERVKVNREWVSSKGRTHTGNIRWDLLKRSGTNAERSHSPGGFYPIYVCPDTGKIEKIGSPLPSGVSEAPINT